MIKSQNDPSTTSINDAFPSKARISEYIYRYLLKEIIKGQILPSARLIESNIAKKLNVSRTPVREALHLMEYNGWIESIPRIGYLVRPISRQELREMREIRFVNESLAIRWAIDYITPEKIYAMEKKIAEAETDILKSNWENFVEKAADFHGLLVEASGSVQLVELCKNFRNHMLRYRLQSLYNREACLQVNEGHRRLLDKVKQLDPEGAVAELSEHLKMSESIVVRYAFKAKTK